MNKVFLLGRLGKDPEVTYSQATPPLAIAKFSLATSEKVPDGQGGREEKTEWHNVVAFGKTAELAVQYLSKGSRVFIEGKIATRSYEKDGRKNYFTEINAASVQFLDSPGESRGPRAPAGRSDATAPAFPPSEPRARKNAAHSDLDDIPF